MSVPQLQEGRALPGGDVQQGGAAVVCVSMDHLPFLILSVNEWSENAFYHPTEVLSLHQGKAADTPIPFPADKGELVPGFDSGFLTDIFWEHHLPPFIDRKDCFNVTS